MSEAPGRPAQAPDLTRRTLTPFGYAVCAVVPLLLAAAAFTFLHFHYDKEDLVSGSHLDILTSDWKPGDTAGDTAVTGRLALDDGCLRLDVADGTTVDLVWPAGYEATVQRVGSTDQLKVYDPARDIVARSAQTIQLSGGFTDAGPYTGDACAPGSGQVFLVESQATVVSNT